MARLRPLALALLLVLVQQLVVVLVPDWTRPDLLLVFALALGLRSRATESLILAFAVGFAIDALSGAPTGLYSLLRGTACAATRIVDRALFLRAAAPWLLFAGLYSAVDGLLVGGLMRLFAPDSALGWLDVLARLPGTAIATALVALPIFYAVLRADGDTDADGSVPLMGSRS
jgi:rod shape-determining protein MreD